MIPEYPITLRNKKYGAKLTSFILNHNYSEEDFEHLVINYYGYPKTVREIIFGKIVEKINHDTTSGIIEELDFDVFKKAEAGLVRDLISLTLKINLLNRLKIFKSVAKKATLEEMREWLPLVQLDVFLDVYDAKKNPQPYATKTNEDILKILKDRGDIKDFKLKKDGKRFTITRRKSNNTKNDGR